MTLFLKWLCDIHRYCWVPCVSFMPTFDASPSPSAAKPQNRKFAHILETLLLPKTKFGETLQDSVRRRHTKFGAIRPLGGAKLRFCLFLLTCVDLKLDFHMCCYCGMSLFWILHKFSRHRKNSTAIFDFVKNLSKFSQVATFVCFSRKLAQSIVRQSDTIWWRQIFQFPLCWCTEANRN